MMDKPNDDVLELCTAFISKEHSPGGCCRVLSVNYILSVLPSPDSRATLSIEYSYPCHRTGKALHAYWEITELELMAWAWNNPKY